jgi:hypothetical protein
VTTPEANGQGVWDLEVAAKAAADEAGPRVPFTFAYKGEQYTVPPMAEWSLATLRQVARGEFDLALPDLLGDDGYEALTDAGMTVGELTALFDKVAGESGLQP